MLNLIDKAPGEIKKGSPLVRVRNIPTWKNARRYSKLLNHITFGGAVYIKGLNYSWSTVVPYWNELYSDDNCMTVQDYCWKRSLCKLDCTTFGTVSRNWTELQFETGCLQVEPQFCSHLLHLFWLKRKCFLKVFFWGGLFGPTRLWPPHSRGL